MANAAGRSGQCGCRRALGAAWRAGFCAALGWAALALPAPAATGAEATLDPITVEAQRQRAELEHRVRAFVTKIVVAPSVDSLARWSAPLCPLVGGMSSADGEFVLRRISQVASEAHVPLAGEHCQPNLYVLVAADPRALLTAWSKREPALFAGMGMSRLRDFLDTPQPVRAWYEVVLQGSDGAPLSANLAGLSQSGMSTGSGGPGMAGVPNNAHARGMRLSRDELRTLSHVVVVIDAGRVAGHTLGQLADYVALVGLAEIHLNADTGTAPTLLRLFSDPQAAPPGMSDWDRAFLHSLYQVDPRAPTELLDLKVSMLKQIAP